MSTTDDRAGKKLPVTGEVGSEGGSFADSTLQVAAFEGDLGRTAGAVEPEGVETGADDVAKLPGEPPAEPQRSKKR
jgi:hypothetical protein